MLKARLCEEGRRSNLCIGILLLFVTQAASFLAVTFTSTFKIPC